jgi:hypothetical protein
LQAIVDLEANKPRNNHAREKWFGEKIERGDLEWIAIVRPGYDSPGKIDTYETEKQSIDAMPHERSVWTVNSRS